MVKVKRPIEAVIEEVVIKPNKVQPIIVQFQNGELKDEEAKKMKCGLYKDEKNQSVLAMSNDSIVYKGTRPDLDKQLSYTMLAVHNKKTGKIRLIQAERWDVSPVLDQDLELNVRNEDMLYELNTQFAIKKVQRRTEQSQKMKIDVNTAKEDYELKAGNVEIDTSTLDVSVKHDLDLQLPPCNREADHVSKVYNIDDIVPKNLLQTLADAKAAIKEDFKNKSAFYVKTMEAYRESENHVQKIALLLYIEAVANYLNLPTRKQGKKDSDICPYSTDIVNHILDSYSVLSAHGRLRPNSMKDKGIINCIILALMIWDYTLDLELLSSMFKFRLGMKKLSELSRLLLAVPDKDDKQRVTLKLPLPPDVPRVLTKRKRTKN